jgi:hypothetical protein
MFMKAHRVLWASRDKQKKRSMEFASAFKELFFVGVDVYRQF